MLYTWNIYNWASHVAQMVKNPPANAGDIRDTGLIPGLGRSPGGEHGNPLYSCLENPKDRGAWQATVHRVTKRWTWLKQLSMHAIQVYILPPKCAYVHQKTYTRMFRVSLVAQWLRIHLEMQGIRVWSLVQEDPTCRRATEPVCHN